MNKKSLSVLIALVLSACGGDQQNPNLAQFIPEQPKPSPTPNPQPTLTPSPTATPSAAPSPTALAVKIYSHPVYGLYVRAADFGADVSGKTDSSAAIDQALRFAEAKQVSVQLSGKLYISRPIVLDENNRNVHALFGEGMDKTTVRFNTKQKGSYASDSQNSNELDVAEYAGIVVRGRDSSVVGPQNHHRPAGRGL